MQEVSKKEIFDKNIMIYNADYFSFSSNQISIILEESKKYKSITFHTEFKNLKNIKISEKINFLYQKNFNYKEIKFLLYFLKLNLKNNIFFTYWCDNFDLVIKFLKILKFNKDFNILNLKKEWNCIEFYIWKNIYFKFFITDSERLKIKNCFFHKSIFIKNWKIDFSKIFYLWYLEILLSWDFRVHEPPCWFWDLVISNVFRKNEQILQDFENFSEYIEDLNNLRNKHSQGEICKICKDKKFHYEKI